MLAARRWKGSRRKIDGRDYRTSRFPVIFGNFFDRLRFHATATSSPPPVFPLSFSPPTGSSSSSVRGSSSQPNTVCTPPVATPRNFRLYGEVCESVRSCYLVGSGSRTEDGWKPLVPWQLLPASSENRGAGGGEQEKNLFSAYCLLGLGGRLEEKVFFLSCFVCLWRRQEKTFFFLNFLTFPRSFPRQLQDPVMVFLSLSLFFSRF